MVKGTAKKTLKNNESLIKKILNNPALIILIVVLVLVVALLGVYAYIYSGRNVYAYVDQTPIYNYEMSNEIVNQAYKNNVNLDSIGTDPKGAFVKYTLTDFAKREVISRRLYYLMGIKDGFTCKKDELDKAFYNFKKQVLSGSTNPEQDFKNELSNRGITESELKNVLREKIIAEKEQDKLTSNISVSSEEVKEYFDEWSYAYVKDGQDKEQVFKDNYKQIESDALDLKKQDYLRKYTNKLMDGNKGKIVIDNRYKKFMRWVYRSLLNLAVPSQFKPGTV